MSTKFQKTMLRVGHTYKSPDAEVVVTTERLKHWAGEHKRLTDAGNIVPMHYDHSSEKEMLEPITMDAFKKKESRSAKNSVGFLSEFNLTDDGQAAELVYEVLDDQAAKQSEANVVQVSPVIFKKWKDGAGNEYEDLITHLDIVNHPVDYSQTPATRVDNEPAVVMAIRMGVSEPYKFDASNNEPNLGDIIKSLQLVGVHLPEDTDTLNFFDRLRTALIAANAVNPLVEHTEPGGSNTFDQHGETMTHDPQFTAMSLETPEGKFVTNQYRESQQGKLDSMLAAGQMTPAEHTDQTTSLTTVRLSLNDQGEAAPTTVSEFITNREALPKGTFWSDEQKTAGGKVQTEEQPEPTRMSVNPDGSKEPTPEDDYATAMAIVNGE